jgi:hypothetical protein
MLVSLAGCRTENCHKAMVVCQTSLKNCALTAWDNLEILPIMQSDEINPRAVLHVLRSYSSLLFCCYGAGASAQK